MNSWFDMFDILILTTVKVKWWRCVIHDPTSWRLVCENCRRSHQTDLHPHRLCGQRHIMAWQFPPVLIFWYLLQHRNLAIPHNPPWQNCIIVHFNLITNQHWNFVFFGNINSLLLDPLFLSILSARNILRPEPSQRIAQQKTLQAVWNSAMVEDLIPVANWKMVWGRECYTCSGWAWSRVRERCLQHYNQCCIDRTWLCL